jgi:hypothetical protein
MSGWRDFALRGFNSRAAAVGQGAPNEFAKPVAVSRELKGEG